MNPSLRTSLYWKMLTRWHNSAFDHNHRVRQDYIGYLRRECSLSLNAARRMVCDYDGDEI